MVNALAQALDVATQRLHTRVGRAIVTEWQRQTTPSFRERILRPSFWGDNGVDGSSRGFKLYAKLQWCLDAFSDTTGAPLRRSFHQRVFHRHMSQAALPAIFGDEWQMQAEAIKSKFGITERVLQNVIISTPRRWGKTFSVAMFVAACLYALPSFPIVVFSVAKRQSNMLMDTIHSFYEALPGATARYKRKNNEIIEVFDGYGGVSSLRCLPGRAETTRGVGGKLIILEEAAFIHEKIFYDVIVPLLGVRQTVLIGISTPPKDGFNYYLHLFNCMDADGLHIFQVEKVELQCTECRKAEKKSCPHIRIPEPKWKTKTRQSLQECIYATNPEVLLREVYGMQISSDVYVFAAQYVDALMAQATGKPEVLPFNKTDKAKFVFIGIDPSGGGNGSDTGIVALTYRPLDYHPVVSVRTSQCYCFSRRAFLRGGCSVPSPPPAAGGGLLS